MEIQKKKITELKPAPYNPRKSNKKQEDNLRKSTLSIAMWLLDECWNLTLI